MTSGERTKATYEFKPVDHLVRTEFYIWSEAIEKWKKEGLPEDYNEKNIFNYDPSGFFNSLLNLGWCEPPFYPAYEDKVVKTEGDIEIIQDSAGRWLKVFKGRRHGFMPDYIKHPVAEEKDWEEDVSLRLNPDDPIRYCNLEGSVKSANDARGKEGLLVYQGMVGGYMYLRALMGPEDLLYAFHDRPELVHTMMRRWVELMDKGLEKIQKTTVIDELGIGEDICYNHGLLISPDMVKEFLIPYYQEVIGKARKRQKEQLYFYVDSDGFVEQAIPLYLSASMDRMAPFEVASENDVVKIGREYPNLIMSGGIDKRVLAQGKDEIESHLQYIIPAMVKRGGFIPTCDHGVPDNVSYENYMYYRKRICELDH